LTPWEPVWPSDDLTQKLRFRVRRHTEEMARDEAYSFLVFRQDDDALLGLSFGYVRRGVSQSAWLLDGHLMLAKGYTVTRAVRAACVVWF
jgi:ribosomal-protein-alanine N-acetyltransferase